MVGVVHPVTHLCIPPWKRCTHCYTPGVYHHERHPGGYSTVFTLREAPWWVLYTHDTQRGTLVGIVHSYHPERHPGGYCTPCLPPREAPWWVLYCSTNPERHPGGYNTLLISHPERHPGGYILPLSHPERHPGGLFPSILPPREAPWWVIPSQTHPGRHIREV